MDTQAQLAAYRSLRIAEEGGADVPADWAAALSSDY